MVGIGVADRCSDFGDAHDWVVEKGLGFGEAHLLEVAVETDAGSDREQVRHVRGAHLDGPRQVSKLEGVRIVLFDKPKHP